jgi:YVTN family beta-propeller protein
MSPAHPLPFPLLSLFFFCLTALIPFSRAQEPSPWGLAWSPDAHTLAVSDRATPALHVFSPNSPGPARVFSLPPASQPTAVIWPTATRLFVAEYGSGSVAELDASTGSVLRRLPVGGKPFGLALAGDTLLVADYGLHRVLGLDLATGRVRFSVPVARHPAALAATPDGALAVSGGLLPDGPGSSSMAASLVLIDVPAGKIVSNFPLPNGSSNLRTVAISHDGAFAFATHTIGKIALPTTQPDRGWITTNAVTVLDLGARRLVATFLLDTPTSGAADPWGVACLPDGSVALSLSGTGQLVRFDWPRTRRLLAGEEKLPVGRAIKEHADPGTPAYGGTPAQLWARIAADPAERRLLAADLAVTSGPGLVPRFPTGAQGLRALALSPDGRSLAAVAFFDGAVRLFSPADARPLATLSLSTTPFTESPARRGERLFHDANLAFQTWMSCATCHHEGRTDGLNWDLLNDGIGNAKNTKSLLLAPRTEPMTWLGVREDHLLSIKKGMHFFMSEPDPADIPAIAAYFNSLVPEPSPHLSPAPVLARGRDLFKTLDCLDCHSGELFTDLKKHDVGTGTAEDNFARYDTPPLIELWRTAPYLHDGSANTVSDVLTTRNHSGDHGDTANLPPADLDALLAYLLSL